MGFTPRTTTPTKGNKYYNNKENCGYLTNILGNYPYEVDKSKRTGLPGLNTLPNCVAWACGRFCEISNKKKLIYNFNTDAKNFITLAKKLGLEVGTTPKLGAIIVWSGKYGHVAVVEKIYSDTEILISQSGWSYKGGAMWTATHKKGNGQWVDGDDKNWMVGNYQFLGFIYHPDVTDTKVTTKDIINVDGVFGSKTIKYTQKRLKTTVDGFISSQPLTNKNILIAINKECFEFTKNAKGSQVIKALQNFLMMPIKACNGILDIQTIKKLQNWLKRKGLYKGTVNGILDTETVKSWQIYLNNYYKVDK